MTELTVDGEAFCTRLTRLLIVPPFEDDDEVCDSGHRFINLRVGCASVLLPFPYRSIFVDFDPQAAVALLLLPLLKLKLLACVEWVAANEELVSAVIGPPGEVLEAVVESREYW